MQQETGIFADEALSNIFNGKLVSNHTANSNQQYKIVGYRLESSIQENINVIAKTPETPTGIYQATTFLDGVKRRGRGADGLFFPKNWTKEKVIAAISEAYQNRALKTSGDQYFTGEASDGIKISLWLDENEKVVDATPSRDNLLRKRRKSPKSRICKQCGQQKHYVCQTPHNLKKKGLPKFYRMIRRYSRKFYFVFARKLGFVENK